MRPAALATATAAALAGVVLAAAPAQAHTTLASATPAKGSTVDSPASVKLTYTDPVGFPGVVVVDAKGGHHESGKAHAVDNTVTEKVAGPLAPGVYTVGWRVVAPDGHPVTGDYRFTVRASEDSSSAAPTSSGPPSAGPAITPTLRTGPSGSGASWWWVGLGLLVVAAGGGGLALFRRRR